MENVLRHYLLRFKGQPKRTQHYWTISWLPSGIVLNNCGKAIGLVPTPMQVYLSKSYILHPLFNTTQKTAKQARKKKPFSSNLSWSIFELYHGFRAGGGGQGWPRGARAYPIFGSMTASVKNERTIEVCVCCSWWCHRTFAPSKVHLTLFVFLKSDCKQNARSLLTPVSDPAFQALSHVAFVLLSMVTFSTIFLLGQNSSTAIQNL